MPSDSKMLAKNRYLCDGNCPSRGCSCNLINPDDHNDDRQYRDEQNRLLPCSEYMWSEDGFDVTCNDCALVLGNDGRCSEAPEGCVMCGRKEHGKHPNGEQYHTNCWACHCCDPITDGEDNG